MTAIRILDDLVANQIAAGEVVERPASAVKELLENAIDAGATQISVRIADGGLTQIDVQDNGCGIPADDIALAFVRHATSKLTSLADLQRLQFLGFRGEALPSIASVSKLTLRTRTRDAEVGVEVRYAAGEQASREPVGIPVGTRVIVSDLFYNTPARLKFVRSLQTEGSHVVDVVARAAVARPDIAFAVTVDGKEQWSTTGDGLLHPVYSAVFGSAVAKGAVAVISENADYQLQGLISLPEHARTTRQSMWFAINGRPIRSLALANAVLDGYYTTLPKGRYPIVSLNVAMDATLVDVNVHPSKLEVRFSEERDLREVVKVAVQEALRAGLIAPEVKRFTVLGDHTAQPQIAAESPRPFVSSTSHARQRETLQHRSLPSKESQQLAFAIQQPVATAMEPAQPELHGAPSGADRQANAPASLRAVAQVMQMYIVAEEGDAVYLIDQHAAHERVLYEKFRTRVRAGESLPLDLLVPVTIEVQTHEANVLEGAASELQPFGLLYERFGDSAFVVRAVPSFWEGLAIEQLTRDVFTDLLEERQSHALGKDVGVYEERLILRACKAAVKANQKLSMPEMDALLRALSTLENPFTCPHGRPTAIRISRAQLEREFKRTM